MAKRKIPVDQMTNKQLCDEWNEGCWARLARKDLTAEQEARLVAIEAEARARPAEEDAA